MKDSIRAQRFVAELAVRHRGKFIDEEKEYATAFTRFFREGGDDEERQAAIECAMVGVDRRVAASVIIARARAVMAWEPEEEKKEIPVPKHVKKVNPKKKKGFL